MATMIANSNKTAVTIARTIPADNGFVSGGIKYDYSPQLINVKLTLNQPTNKN